LLVTVLWSSFAFSAFARFNRDLTSMATINAASHYGRIEDHRG